MSQYNIKNAVLAFFTDYELWRMVRIGRALGLQAIPPVDGPADARVVIRKQVNLTMMITILRYIAQESSLPPEQLETKFWQIRDRLVDVTAVRTTFLQTCSDEEALHFARLLNRRFLKYPYTSRPEIAKQIVSTATDDHFQAIMAGLARAQSGRLVPTLPNILWHVRQQLHEPPPELPPPRIVRFAPPRELPRPAPPPSDPRQRMFKYFSDRELWKIMLLIAHHAVGVTPAYVTPETVRNCTEPQVPTALFFGAINRLAGHCGDVIESAEMMSRFQAARQHLSKLSKRKLEIGLKSPWLSPTQRPPMPEGFALNHPHYGTVTVSQHAWKRFCYRYLQACQLPIQFDNHSQTQLARTMQGLFASAQPEQLDEYERLIRLANNECQPATYLRELNRNMRFVLVTDGEQQWHMVTAEIAYLAMKFTPLEPVR